jgi:dihydroorotate dehydrogenase (NAD+) catalytic subunit
LDFKTQGLFTLLKRKYLFKKYNTAIIANIAGNTIDDYCKMAEILQDADIDAIELNVSCPNVKQGGVAFGNTCAGISEVTKRVRAYCKKPLIVKLTPNVTDIKEIAKAAEDAGADSLSLINTILGMAIDIHRRRPVLAQNFGGLSGPAVKPVALRMVYEVAHTVKIPVIGMGGISTGEDAVEFCLPSHAVMVGTMNFVKPHASIDVVKGIEKYLEQYNISSVMT